MAIQIIFARAANGVIGKDNAMPWHLPEDMTHFKELTRGCAVVMGRKTWDSLPARFRPLPGRTNIVITRQSDWQPEPASDKVVRTASLPEALEVAQKLSADVWVMGGAQIYAQALPLADAVEVTEIAQDFEGDAHAPELGPEWKEVSRSAHTSVNGLNYSFVRFERG